MTDRKFTVMEERLLGEMNPDQKKHWNLLLARRRRLVAQQEVLETDTELFLDAVTEAYVLENHESIDGIGVSNAGTIVQSYCACYKCQTKLQNLPASFVVEEMYKQKRIPVDRIAAAREWAITREKYLGKPMPN